MGEGSDRDTQIAATMHVYCGCTILLGPFTERECSWEGDVPISDEPEFDTFDCPECGMKGLLVTQHEVYA